MNLHSFNHHSNSKLSHRHKPTQSTPLGKLFRLYSPNNFIRAQKLPSSLPIKQNEKAVIQLIFPHPNLLFIHPHTIKDPAQKQAFIQLNMMKNIIERKHYSLNKNITGSQKPMTAPNLRRGNQKNISLTTVYRRQKQNSVNLCTLNCDKENTNQQFNGTTVSWRKKKTLTSKSQFRKSQMKQKENEELRTEKDLRGKVFSRNTFDAILEEKKKELEEKYDEDKMTREELYRKSVKSPHAQKYIDIEGKFLKYFKQ